MKIAIQGHSTRGKEVIQILESLGGKNDCPLKGHECWYYYIDADDKTIRCHDYKYVNKYCKKYTLEEFEKKFPFKIGDLCIYYSEVLNTEIIVKILGMAITYDSIMYEVGHKDTTKEHSGIYKRRYALKPYKEMKEERNITLTLNKAKEWYKKGGDLKQVALQAYSEEELTKVELPKTWEEFCTNYPIREGEAIIDEQTSQIRRYNGIVARGLSFDKNICPSKKSAEAHLAMIQLEQLRDCWRQGWKPNWNDINQSKFCINFYQNTIVVDRHYEMGYFLSFPTREMAEEFLKCFRDLIEKAGDLI